MTWLKLLPKGYFVGKTPNTPLELDTVDVDSYVVDVQVSQEGPLGDDEILQQTVIGLSFKLGEFDGRRT